MYYIALLKRFRLYKVSFDNNMYKMDSEEAKLKLSIKKISNDIILDYKPPDEVKVGTKVIAEFNLTKKQRKNRF